MNLWALPAFSYFCTVSWLSSSEQSPRNTRISSASIIHLVGVGCARPQRTEPQGCHAAARQSEGTGGDGAVAGSNLAEQKLCSKGSTTASSFQRLRCIKCFFFFLLFLFLTPNTRIAPSAWLLLTHDTFEIIFTQHLSIKRMRSSLCDHFSREWLTLADGRSGRPDLPGRRGITVQGIVKR